MVEDYGEKMREKLAKRKEEGVEQPSVKADPRVKNKMREYDDHCFGAIMHYMAASGLKYAGLMCGIMGVVGEDFNTSKVAAGCLGFLVGTLWDRTTTRSQAIIELEALEEKLKGEQ